MISPDILALFTNARRLHEGLTPSRLDGLLDVPAGSTRAVEQRRDVRPATRAAFLQFNGLEQPRGGQGQEARRPEGPTGKRESPDRDQTRGEEGRSADREAKQEQSDHV